jgi:hypothetical protein
MRLNGIPTKYGGFSMESNIIAGAKPSGIRREHLTIPMHRSIETFISYLTLLSAAIGLVQPTVRVFRVKWKLIL